MDVVGGSVSSMRRKRLEDDLGLVLQRLWPEKDVSEAQLKQLDDDDVSDEQSDRGRWKSLKVGGASSGWDHGERVEREPITGV